jgi:hypothetical protein
MSATDWAYPADFLEQLLTHGLAPAPATPPALVRDALNDLYRFEIRRLRERLRGGQVEKATTWTKSWRCARNTGCCR